MTQELDYEALGFKAGLEIHQQLDTRKLFCRCPSELDEDVDARFLRTLRPTQSELGAVDPAALAEARKRLVFRYDASRDTACLVDMDEEPPHAVTPEAFETALEVALLLNARPVDEMHVMRKIVIDGSNTGGFQRTCLYALDGSVESSLGPVGVATMCLEEDSSRRLERVGNVQGFRLDRLGIPLVEIATTPDIKGPAHAREVALAIGTALRATGKVKRGLGTIRQDLNVSIREGARVEVKGVQDLRVIEPAVEYEVRRQVRLLEVRDELKKRGATPDAVRAAGSEDVTDLFEKTEAKLVKGALKGKGRVLALPLPGFAGLLGKKGAGKPKADEVPEPRFGRELADYAKVGAGVKGIFHSDELPAYGITQEETDAVRDRVAPGEVDAFVLVVERRNVAERALDAVRERALVAFEGVPEETRDVLEDGSSRYLRPLPGGARMYPETDVPPVLVEEGLVERIRANLPEMPAEKEARWRKDYPELSEEQVRTLVRSEDALLFERVAKETGLAKEAARVFLQTLPELGIREALTEAQLVATFEALEGDKFAKEAMPQVLQYLAEKEGSTPEEAAEALGLGAVDLSEVEAFVDGLLDEKADFVQARGMGAVGPLMGPVMGRFKGKVSGKDLSDVLQRKIRERVQ